MSQFFSQADRNVLFEAAEATLLRDMGHVSIVKFLGGTEEGEAQAKWFGVLEAFLASLPAGMFLKSDVSRGSPALVFHNGLRIEVDLYELHGRPSRDDAWRMMAKPGLAAIVIDAVAAARWGEAWDDAISAEESMVETSVKPAGGSMFGGWARAVQEDLAMLDLQKSRGWIVRATPTEAPWPWFTDEHRARRAAVALALGTDVVGALYRRMERDQPPHE